MIIRYRWVTEAISGEPGGDENILERPVDLGPSGVAHGEPSEGYGKTVPGKPEQAPGAVVHEGKTGLAEPAGEGEKGTRPKPRRRRNILRSGVPSTGEPTEEAATGGPPAGNERLAYKPALTPADRNNRIGALDWEEAWRRGLTSREEKIIRMRYGFREDGEYTLQEIADDFGVSIERIRQLEDKSLRKLRSSHPRRRLEK